MPQAFRIACRSDDAQLSAGEYLCRLALAAPHIGQRQHARFDDQRHFVSGIIATQIRAAIFYDEPPNALAWPRIGKAELDHDAATTWKFAKLDEAPHIPHQETGIELAGLQPAADPSCAPVAERHNDGAQLLTSGGEPVLIRTSAADTLDYSDLFKLS